MNAVVSASSPASSNVAQALAALQRAAVNARVLAEQTGTELIVRLPANMPTAPLPITPNLDLIHAN
jgi:hypothetical protein